MQNEDTNANWTMVRVAGLSNAVRIDLEDVFVNAEDQYHITHNIYSKASVTTVLNKGGIRTEGAYDKLVGDGRTQSVCQLVRVLAHAPGSDMPNRIADPPLPVVTEGLRFVWRPCYSTVPARLPSVTGGSGAIGIAVLLPGACRPSIASSI